MKDYKVFLQLIGISGSLSPSRKLMLSIIYQTDYSNLTRTIYAYTKYIFINIEACPSHAAASLLPSFVTNFASPKGIEIETK